MLIFPFLVVRLTYAIFVSPAAVEEIEAKGACVAVDADVPHVVVYCRDEPVTAAPLGPFTILAGPPFEADGSVRVFGVMVNDAALWPFRLSSTRLRCLPPAS
jgi:hypothetical protein